jgi:glycosyltransferase involved in cell wall biosynthesis
LFSESQAFINPQIEDFGILAVEIMASGRPVVAFGQGGATECIIENETGIFFHKQNWEHLFNAIIKFQKINWDSEKIKNHAEKFNTFHFKNIIKQFVTDRFEEFKKDIYQAELLK